MPVPYTRDDARASSARSMPRGWAEDTGVGLRGRGTRAGTPARCALRDEGDGRAELAFGVAPVGARHRARWSAACGCCSSGASTERGARRGHLAGPRRQLGARAGWPGGSGFSFDGHRAPVAAAARRAARRLGRHAAGAASPREPRTTWLDLPGARGRRVRLRPWRADDAARIVEACRDERTAHWLGRMPGPYTRGRRRGLPQDRREVLAHGQRGRLGGRGRRERRRWSARSRCST